MLFIFLSMFISDSNIIITLNHNRLKIQWQINTILIFVVWTTFILVCEGLFFFKYLMPFSSYSWNMQIGHVWQLWNREEIIKNWSLYKRKVVAGWTGRLGVMYVHLWYYVLCSVPCGDLNAGNRPIHVSEGLYVYTLLYSRN